MENQNFQNEAKPAHPLLRAVDLELETVPPMSQPPTKAADPLDQ